MCPNCGFPMGEESGYGVIRLYWADKKGHSLRQTRIVVDGEEIGIMKCEDCVDLKFAYGIHKLELYQNKHLLISESILISKNNQEESFCFKEKMGLTHAVLKRTKDKIPNNVIHKDLQAKHIPKCPTCGSPNIKKISLTRKVLAFEMIGFASGSIAKTFMCKDCGNKW